MSLNLHEQYVVSNFQEKLALNSYRESVLRLAIDCSSSFLYNPSRSKSHTSNWVSFEKPSSTAPALVPVASKMEDALGDQAKVAVRGMSRRPNIAGALEDGESWGNYFSGSNGQ